MLEPLCNNGKAMAVSPTVINVINKNRCITDPNFAVVCSFLEKFSKICGLTYPPFAELQAMLEYAGEVPPDLVDLHVKLLRKVKRSVVAEKWERPLAKFCYSYSPTDSWKIEHVGYSKLPLDCKLRILKILIDAQFDINVKLKNDINKLPADDLRIAPIGKDKYGRTYWAQVDVDTDIRVYKEDLEEQTWEIVASDRESLISLITQLSADQDPELLRLDNGEDDTSSDDTAGLGKGNPPTSDEPQENNSPDMNDEEGNFSTGKEEKENINEEEGNSDEQIMDSLKTKINEKFSKIKPELEKGNILKTKVDNLKEIVHDSTIRDYVNELNRSLTNKKNEFAVKNVITSNFTHNFTPGLKLDQILKSKLAQRMEKAQEDNEKGQNRKIEFEDYVETKKMKIGNYEDNGNSIDQEGEYEEIEEPVMIITGRGSGVDCETGNISGKERENKVETMDNGGASSSKDCPMERECNTVAKTSDPTVGSSEDCMLDLQTFAFGTLDSLVLEDPVSEPARGESANVTVESDMSSKSESNDLLAEYSSRGNEIDKKEVEISTGKNENEDPISDYKVNELNEVGNINPKDDHIDTEPKINEGLANDESIPVEEPENIARLKDVDTLCTVSLTRVDTTPKANCGSSAVGGFDNSFDAGNEFSEDTRNDQSAIELYGLNDNRKNVQESEGNDVPIEENTESSGEVNLENKQSEELIEGEKLKEGLADDVDSISSNPSQISLQDAINTDEEDDILRGSNVDDGSITSEMGRISPILDEADKTKGKVIQTVAVTVDDADSIRKETHDANLEVEDKSKAEVEDSEALKMEMKDNRDITYKNVDIVPDLGTSSRSQEGIAGGIIEEIKSSRVEEKMVQGDENRSDVEFLRKSNTFVDSENISGNLEDQGREMNQNDNSDVISQEDLTKSDAHSNVESTDQAPDDAEQDSSNVNIATSESNESKVSVIGDDIKEQITEEGKVGGLAVKSEEEEKEDDDGVGLKTNVSNENVFSTHKECVEGIKEKTLEETKDLKVQGSSDVNVMGELNVSVGKENIVDEQILEKIKIGEEQLIEEENKDEDGSALSWKENVITAVEDDQQKVQPENKALESDTIFEINEEERSTIASLQKDMSTVGPSVSSTLENEEVHVLKNTEEELSGNEKEWEELNDSDLICEKMTEETEDVSSVVEIIASTGIEKKAELGDAVDECDRAIEMEKEPKSLAEKDVSPVDEVIGSGEISEKKISECEEGLIKLDTNVPSGPIYEDNTERTKNKVSIVEYTSSEDDEEEFEENNIVEKYDSSFEDVPKGKSSSHEESGKVIDTIKFRETQSECEEEVKGDSGSEEKLKDSVSDSKEKNSTKIDDIPSSSSFTVCSQPAKDEDFSLNAESSSDVTVETVSQQSPQNFITRHDKKESGKELASEDMEHSSLSEGEQIPLNLKEETILENSEGQNLTVENSKVVSTHTEHHADVLLQPESSQETNQDKLESCTTHFEHSVYNLSNDLYGDIRESSTVGLKEEKFLNFDNGSTKSAIETLATYCKESFLDDSARGTLPVTPTVDNKNIVNERLTSKNSEIDPPIGSTSPSSSKVLSQEFSSTMAEGGKAPMISPEYSSPKKDIDPIQTSIEFSADSRKEVATVDESDLTTKDLSTKSYGQILPVPVLHKTSINFAEKDEAVAIRNEEFSPEREDNKAFIDLDQKSSLHDGVYSKEITDTHEIMEEKSSSPGGQEEFSENRYEVPLQPGQFSSVSGEIEKGKLDTGFGYPKKNNLPSTKNDTEVTLDTSEQEQDNTSHSAKVKTDYGTLSELKEKEDRDGGIMQEGNAAELIKDKRSPEKTNDEIGPSISGDNNTKETPWTSKNSKSKEKTSSDHRRKQTGSSSKHFGTQDDSDDFQSPSTGESDSDGEHDTSVPVTNLSCDEDVPASPAENVPTNEDEKLPEDASLNSEALEEQLTTEPENETPEKSTAKTSKKIKKRKRGKKWKKVKKHKKVETVRKVVEQEAHNESTGFSDYASGATNTDVTSDEEVVVKKPKSKAKSKVKSKKTKAKKKTVESDYEEDSEEDKKKKKKENKKEQKKEKKIPKSKSNTKNKKKAKQEPRSESSNEEPDDEEDEKEKRKNSKTTPILKSRILLGLDVSAVQMDLDSGPGIRQSRRIAQMKIKQQAEGKYDEPPTTPKWKKSAEKPKEKSGKKKVDKSKGNKKRKMSEDSDEAEYKLPKHETPKGKKKKKKKDTVKVFNTKNPWKSSSGSSSSEQEDEIEHYEEEEEEEELDIILASDHEFSPESDLDDEDYEPVKRARTAHSKPKAVDDGKSVRDDLTCLKCQKADQPEWILLCDTCDNGWHASCLYPPLMAVPEGDWYCPPCQHNILLNGLHKLLRRYDANSAKRQNEELRKKRLEFVTVNSSNILHDNKEVKKDGRMGAKEEATRAARGGESSEMSDSDFEMEPLYTLRVRRQKNVSHRLNQYDQMINSAIQDEVEAKLTQNEVTPVEREQESTSLEGLNQGDVNQSEEMSRENGSGTETNADTDPGMGEGESNAANESDLMPLRQMGRKKAQPLTKLDVSSDDDRFSDEDFKQSSDDAYEDDEEYAQDDTDSEDLGTGRKQRRGKAEPTRRSTRARTSRFDNDYLDDDTEEESDPPKKKKGKRPWDDSDSEEDDSTWGKKKKNKYSAPWKPKPKKRKRITFGGSDEDEKPQKRSRVAYGLDESDEELPYRRTRGKKINYQESLESASDAESKSKKIKSDEDEEYVQEEEVEDEEVLEEKEELPANEEPGPSTDATAEMRLDESKKIYGKTTPKKVGRKKGSGVKKTPKKELKMYTSTSSMEGDTKLVLRKVDTLVKPETTPPLVTPQEVSEPITAEVKNEEPSVVSPQFPLQVSSIKVPSLPNREPSFVRFPEMTRLMSDSRNEPVCFTMNPSAVPGPNFMPPSYLVSHPRPTMPVMTHNVPQPQPTHAMQGNPMMQPGQLPTSMIPAGVIRQGGPVPMMQAPYQGPGIRMMQRGPMLPGDVMHNLSIPTSDSGSAQVKRRGRGRGKKQLELERQQQEQMLQEREMIPLNMLKPNPGQSFHGGPLDVSKVSPAQFASSSNPMVALRGSPPRQSTSKRVKITPPRMRHPVMQAPIYRPPHNTFDPSPSGGSATTIKSENADQPTSMPTTAASEDSISTIKRERQSPPDAGSPMSLTVSKMTEENSPFHDTTEKNITKIKVEDKQNAKEDQPHPPIQEYAVSPPPSDASLVQPDISKNLSSTQHPSQSGMYPQKRSLPQPMPSYQSRPIYGAPRSAPTGPPVIPPRYAMQQMHGRPPYAQPPSTHGIPSPYPVPYPQSTAVSPSNAHVASSLYGGQRSPVPTSRGQPPNPYAYHPGMHSSSRQQRPPSPMVPTTHPYPVPVASHAQNSPYQPYQGPLRPIVPIQIQPLQSPYGQHANLTSPVSSASSAFSNPSASPDNNTRTASPGKPSISTSPSPTSSHSTAPQYGGTHGDRRHTLSSPPQNVLPTSTPYSPHSSSSTGHHSTTSGSSSAPPASSHPIPTSPFPILPPRIPPLNSSVTRAAQSEVADNYRDSVQVRNSNFQYQEFAGPSDDSDTSDHQDYPSYDSRHQYRQAQEEEEETTGEFGGLVSYFSSQREDDLDS